MLNEIYKKLRTRNPRKLTNIEMAISEKEQRELAVAQQQILQLNQQKHLLDITEKELVENNKKDFIYKNIGKAYFKQSKDSFKKQINENNEMLDEHLNAIHKKVEFLTQK